MKKGTLVVLENTGQVGKIVNWNYSSDFAKVKIVTPDGPKIVVVLKYLIHVVEIVDGLIPILKKIWKTLFPKKKHRKKRAIIIDPDRLPL